MNELLKIYVNKEISGLMIKEILYDHFNFSRKSLTKVKNAKGIYLNGEPVYVTQRAYEGDMIQIYVLEETSEFIEPQSIPLDIVYEDQDIVVVNKPSGIVVHPTKSHPDGTLANGLLYYWQMKGQSFRFRPVHRLDKDTSGLLVIAKNQYAHHKLALQLFDRSLKRIYRAIVHGYVNEEKGIIDGPIIKDPDHATRRMVEIRPDSEAKTAITFYRTVERFSDSSLVELQLETGRTHQIRVHMSWIGHPLIGDELYGGKTGNGYLNRQALHAYQLNFYHPISNELLSFNAPLPEDMQSFLYLHFS